MHRDADGARLVGDGPGDGLPDPPRGVGRELVAAPVLELVHRLHQADVAFLDQVQELQPAVGVLLGDGDHQAQVGLDHLLLGAPRLGLADGHAAVDVLDLADRQPALALDLDQPLLGPLDLVPVLLEHGRVAVPGLDLPVQPRQIGLVVRERGDEILARHVRLLHAGAHDHALVPADAVDHVAQILHQLVHDARDQLELQQALRHLLDELARALVLAPMLGRSVLRLGVELAQLREPARGLRRVGSGLRHLLGVLVLIAGARLGRGGRRGHLVPGVGVDEAGNQVGQTKLAGLHHLVLRQHVGDGLGVHRQGGEHLLQAVLDALGDLDLALAGEQLHRAHLAHVHAHRVGGAAGLGLHGGQRGGGLLGGILVGGDVFVAEQQVLHVRGHLVHGDAHVVDHPDDLLDLLGINDLVGQMVIDLCVSEVALLLALGDQGAELRLLLVTVH